VFEVSHTKRNLREMQIVFVVISFSFKQMPCSCGGTDNLYMLLAQAGAGLESDS